MFNDLKKAGVLNNTVSPINRAVTPCFHNQPSVCRAYASIGKLARLAIDIDDYCDD
jgi:hypothetical protein